MKVVYLIFFILSLCLYGCKTEVIGFVHQIEKLQASTSSTGELQNATALNDYATDQHLAYSLEITDLETLSPIRLDKLEHAMNKKLSVTISVSDNNLQAIWKPIDNNNIFILLRE